MFVPTSFPQSAQRFVLGALAVVAFGAVTVLSPSLAAQIAPEIPSAAVGKMAAQDMVPRTAKVEHTAVRNVIESHETTSGGEATAAPARFLPWGCLWCMDTEEGHYAGKQFAPMSGWGPGSDGTHWATYPGSCLFEHGFCGYASSRTSPRAVTDAIAEAVALEDVTTLAELIHEPMVKVFAPRSAIQVLGCDGKAIAGHIPLAPALLSLVVGTAALDSDSQ